MMSRTDPLPFVALVLSILGIAGFVFLFIRDFNIYLLILSPVILVVYQFPAVAVFWIYRRRRDKRNGTDAAIDEGDEDTGPETPEEDPR